MLHEQSVNLEDGIRFRRADSPDFADRLSGHMLPLDGLRGIAILMVMVFHLAGEFQRMTGLQPGWLRPLRAGWIGVDLFFVLSGFLITGILLKSKNAPGYFRNFYARRILRICPLYFAFLLILFGPLYWLVPERIYKLQDAYTKQGWWWLYGSNILASRLGDWTCPSLDHFWSLAVEEHFYLAWPLLVYFLGKRHFLFACCACVVFAALFRIYEIHQHQPLAGYTLTPCRIDSLAMGALLAAVLRSGDGWHTMVLGFKIALIASLALLVVFCGFHRGFGPTTPMVQAFGHTLLGIAFVATIFFAVGSPAPSLVSTVLSHATLRFFGKYAYALYVFHPVLEPIRRKTFSMIGLQGMAGFLGYSLVGILSTLVFALVSWHLLEKRCIGLKRFFEVSPVTETGRWRMRFAH